MTGPTVLSDVLRADAGLVLVGEWATASQQDQRSAADAHRRAVAEPAARLRRTTQQFPGVTGIAVQRFTPYRGMTLPDR